MDIMPNIQAALATLQVLRVEFLVRFSGDRRRRLLEYLDLIEATLHSSNDLAEFALLRLQGVPRLLTNALEEAEHEWADERRRLHRQ